MPHFRFQRYALSARLPEIVAALHAKVLPLWQGNFFVIELIGEDGQRLEYEVYFEVSRSSKKGRGEPICVGATCVMTHIRVVSRRRSPLGFVLLIQHPEQQNYETRRKSPFQELFHKTNDLLIIVTLGWRPLLWQGCCTASDTVPFILWLHLWCTRTREKNQHARQAKGSG